MPKDGAQADGPQAVKMAASGSALHAPSPRVWVMGAVSFVVLAVGFTIALMEHNA